eukprot:scaffold1951_cov186-Alexandrium_tamarense.AAC.7
MLSRQGHVLVVRYFGLPRVPLVPAIPMTRSHHLDARSGRKEHLQHCVSYVVDTICCGDVDSVMLILQVWWRVSRTVCMMDEMMCIRRIFWVFRASRSDLL